MTYKELKKAVEKYATFIPIATKKRATRPQLTINSIEYWPVDKIKKAMEGK